VVWAALEAFGKSDLQVAEHGCVVWGQLAYSREIYREKKRHVKL
jgi:hypothetical protein